MYVALITQYLQLCYQLCQHVSSDSLCLIQHMPLHTLCHILLKVNGLEEMNRYKIDR